MLPIRVAHIPGSHPYVSNISDVNISDVSMSGSPSFVTLADVIPAHRARGQWWPPVMFDPAWIESNADQFDVMHLHFGFESFSATHVASCIEALASVGRPLVFTVHDLENPQLFDQAPHRRHLDALLSGATLVTTLTDSAALEIFQRWGREATVIRHPHLLPLESTAADGVPDPRERPTAVVGMHLGDIRPGTDARGATTTLIDAIRLLRAGGVAVEAEVHVRTTVRDESARSAVAAACAGADGVRLIEHPRLSDDDLVRSLAALDACMLPYRHGTHSGWLELCFDLGVPVLGPTVGHWLDQHAEEGAVVGFDSRSVESLATGIMRALVNRHGMPRRAVRSRRRAQRIEQRGVIAREHAQVYRSALARTARAQPALEVDGQTVHDGERSRSGQAGAQQAEVLA